MRSDAFLQLVDFVPPHDLCTCLRQHTQSWPIWLLPGWSPLSMTDDPWVDLLRASGRGAHSTST